MSCANAVSVNREGIIARSIGALGVVIVSNADGRLHGSLFSNGIAYAHNGNDPEAKGRATSEEHPSSRKYREWVREARYIENRSLE